MYIFSVSENVLSQKQEVKKNGMQTYIYIYIHAYIHTYIHTHTYIYEKRNDLCHSANISRAIEITRIMKWPGHVARIAALRNTYKNWIAKPTT